jgi:pimeloyl-ACP methyl ester carboxylesterase
MNAHLMQGISSHRLRAGDRLDTHYLSAGSSENPLVLLIHGNVSSSLFWMPLMNALSTDHFVVAPDLRGYGDSEAKPIDARNGVADWSEDVHAFISALDLGAAHVVGWSLGAGVAMQLLIDHSADVKTLTLQAPVSPFGFGGTRADGSLCNTDASGTGGGAANAEFVANLKAGMTEDAGPTSPRGVMRAFYVADPTCFGEHEDTFVASMLSTRVGDDFYPGTSAASEHWPMIAPGDRGVLNTLSPKYFNTSGIVDVPSKPPILWVRGEADQIVGDMSFFDLNTLGQVGAVPGWPGAEDAPPQPMVSQTRDVLERYVANGGSYAEVALAGCGHSPHLERPADVETAMRKHFLSV